MLKRALDAIPLVAAVAIVGVGLYVLLDKGAAIVKTPLEPAKQAATPPQPPLTYQQPSPQRSQVLQGRSSGSEIYRCKQGGSVVYSDTPCDGGRPVDIQVTQGFESQRYPRRAAASEAVINGAAPSREPAVTPPSASNAQVCESIIKAIEGIDAAARAGGTIPYMEDLKERRRKLVEKRQELRC